MKNLTLKLKKQKMLRKKFKIFEYRKSNKHNKKIKVD